MVDGRPPSQPPPARPASRLGTTPLLGAVLNERFHVLHIIGSGGDATVYEAEDLVEGGRVAVKTPHPRADAETAIERFLREGRVGERISHPNVAAVLACALLPNGRPYLVMERLLGETLESRIRRLHKVPVALALGVMMQTLRGLGTVHEFGVIHRDIKPSNVFLAQPSDAAKILDFGSSKFLDFVQSDADLTRVGFAVGTPFYMSPEQAAAAKDIDERTDLYSVGVTLYEALTGRKPYTGRTTREVLTRVSRGGAPPPSTFNLKVSRHLDEVVMRAMSPDRDKRFSSARRFAEALESVGAIVPADEPASEGAPLDYLRQRLHEIAVLHHHSRARGAAARRAAAPTGTATRAVPGANEARYIVVTPPRPSNTMPNIRVDDDDSTGAPSPGRRRGDDDG